MFLKHASSASMFYLLCIEVEFLSPEVHVEESDAPVKDIGMYNNLQVIIGLYFKL